MSGLTSQAPENLSPSAPASNAGGEREQPAENPMLQAELHRVFRTEQEALSAALAMVEAAKNRKDGKGWEKRSRIFNIVQHGKEIGQGLLRLTTAPFLAVSGVVEATGEVVKGTGEVLSAVGQGIGELHYRGPKKKGTELKC